MSRNADRPANAQATRHPAHGEVSVRIEVLVIDGVPFGGVDGRLVGKMVEQELGRFLRQDGLGNSRHGGARAALPAPNITILAPIQERRLGRQIARSIHRALERDS